MTDASQAKAEWTHWVRLDEAAPLLAIGTDQTYDELSGTLVHLQDLGLTPRQRRGYTFRSHR